MQTFSPEHPAIQAAVRHDFGLFAQGEIPSRRQHCYPPFAHMVRVVVRGPVETAAAQFAQHIAGCLSLQVRQLHLDARLLGPAPAPIARLRGKYRFHLQMQAADVQGLHQVVQTATSGLKAPEQVQWIVDVDPLDML